MIPLTLRLRGFRGIKAGIGLNEIFVDLSALPDGIIAVAGENGRGKTTLLDNLHPYRIMPYKIRKAKDWSPNSFSFYDQTFGSDACKELVFEMPGKGVYKSLVLIDADRKKQEAYLYEQAGETWQPLNDGKTRTYDDAVEAVVGSPTLYFSSVFRAQGAKNLSDYTRSDIVGILAELLNIDHIRAQGEKARTVVTELRNRADLIRASVRPAQEDLDAAAVVELDLLAAEGRVPDLQALLAAAQVAHTATQAVVNRHNAEEASRQSEIARGALIRSQIADEQTRHHREEERLGIERREALRRQSSEERSHAADVLALEGRIVSARTASATSLDGQLRTLHSRITEARTSSAQGLAEQTQTIEARLERARKIASGADKIRNAVTKEAGVESLLAGLTPKQTGAGDLLSRAQLRQTDTQAALTSAQDALHAADFKHLTAQQAVSAAQKNIEKLTVSNCPLEKPTCNFVGSAVADRDALPGLTAAVEDAFREQTTGKGLVQQAQADHDSAKTAVQDAQDEVTRLRGQADKAAANLAELRRFTKLLPELEQAEEVIKTAEAELVSCQGKAASDLAVVVAQLEADITTCRERHETDLAANIAQMETDLETRKRRYAGVVDEVAVKLRSIAEAEKAELEHHRLATERLDMELLTVPEYDDLSGVLERARADVLMALSDVNRHSDALRALEGEIAGYRAVLGSVAGKRRVVMEADAQIERLGQSITDFSLLAIAMPGVEALELDDALPSVAIKANDLLFECYGGRYSTRFDTQAENANGTKREALDILVLDAETGEEWSILEKSGGQTLWIEDALTRGISLYNIHRADRIYGTIFSDEKDGALDPKRKMDFFAVKRAALKAGAHTREFFISQTEALVDMADARIEMLPGGVMIR